ncbi:hypothetical protein I3760_09G148500 [Carya illinoinensis]|nr:hypothetical protein I3760_09G148500 [Carya illinoinensis]
MVRPRKSTQEPQDDTSRDDSIAQAIRQMTKFMQQNFRPQQAEPWPQQGGPWPQQGGPWLQQGGPYPQQGGPYPQQGGLWPQPGAPWPHQGGPWLYPRGPSGMVQAGCTYERFMAHRTPHFTGEEDPLQVGK